MTNTWKARRKPISIVISMVAGLVLMFPTAAIAACPGGAEDTWSDDTDNGAVTILGTPGNRTLSHTKDANDNSTCADLNVSFVQFADHYAAQYLDGVWILGSGGVQPRAAGAQTPWWEPITDLNDDASFRGWSDGLDRIITFKS